MVSGWQEGGCGRSWRRLIALGGSSSPAPCTSHRGAGGAPCSGRTRPGHRASPGVSAERKEGVERKTETQTEAGRVRQTQRGTAPDRQTDGEGVPRERACSHRGCLPRRLGPSCLWPVAGACPGLGLGSGRGSYTRATSLDATVPSPRTLGASPGQRQDSGAQTSPR